MITILQGDALAKLKELPDESVQMVCTSPPYYALRDYQVEGQIGLEQTPEAYIQKLVEVFHEVRRVLKNDGVIWINIGDSYYNYRPGKGQSLSKQSVSNNLQDLPQTCARRGNKFDGIKEKDLIGIPWMLAFALRADGWFLRQDIIWSKPNPMPESVTDRCTKSHEYIFLLSKSRKYFFEPITEIATGYDGRNDTMMKGSDKYKDSVVPDKNEHTMAARGHQRWKFKNLQSDGQQPNTMHVKRAEGMEFMSPVRNRRSVWEIATQAYTEAHFATFPEELPKLCILAGTKAGDVVLDPFAGSGTTGKVALELGRKAILIELNPQYIDLIKRRCTTTIGLPL